RSPRAQYVRQSVSFRRSKSRAISWSLVGLLATRSDPVGLHALIGRADDDHERAALNSGEEPKVNHALEPRRVRPQADFLERSPVPEHIDHAALRAGGRDEREPPRPDPRE